MKTCILLLLLPTLLLGDVRDEALALAHEAGTIFQDDPTRASSLAEEAFLLLKKSPDSEAADRGACAALTARAARLAGDQLRAQVWFQTALPLSSPQDSVVLRAELADMLMRTGELAKARDSLGPVPQLPRPSHALAQWQQTSAKLHLACGLPDHARTAIEAAIAALPDDDTANQVALAIDAAGINLRLGLSPTTLLEEAREKLSALPDPHPDIISALTSIAAQNPDLTDDQSLALLQSIDLDSLAQDSRLTFSITIAEAAARAGESELVNQSLGPVLGSDLLPDDHPLLARALALAADAGKDPKLAKQSSDVALRWLANADDSEILLGLQRTVDPLSPLVHHAPELLPQAALTAQNFALRNRLGGQATAPHRQTVLYLIYQKDFEQHYGAIIFSPTPKWIPLGPAEKIHRRIIDTIDTAERTLAEVETGARLSVRLTQLWKSLWQPLEDSLDPSRPIDIAPVGMLHAVPWAILRQRDGNCLCQVFDEVRTLALTGTFPGQHPQTDILACGTSSAPGKLAPQGTFPFDHQLVTMVAKLPALPGIKNELAIFPSGAHENLNRDQFLKLLHQGHGTLHLAGHGFVIESEEGHGFRAGLIFHGGGSENILFARDIAALDLSRTQLVVLSACRGGIGQSEVGGNWSSLRRSFIAAGARQVMAAQWQVRDDHLPRFMGRFYKMRVSMPDHLALWHLQREWIGKGSELDLASAGAWVLESVPTQ